MVACHARLKEIGDGRFGKAYGIKVTLGRLMRTVAAFLAVCAFVLAGCSDGAAEPEAVEEAFEDIELNVTATTGVIRGVVVDEAIRPVAGALVTLNLPGKGPVTDESRDTGAFAFDDLEPGSYFLSAAKGGFLPSQQTAEVVAGVAEPPIVKILLAVDGSYVAPFVQSLVFEGFIECGVTTPVIAGAICGIPNGATCGFPFPPEACLGNVTNDNFSQFIPMDQVPTFIQHELVWEATQSTGNMFNLAGRWAKESGDWGEIKGFIGVSPIVLALNSTEIDDEEIGVNGTGLAPAIFSGGMEGTEPPCDPVLGICAFSTGATIEQSFRLYTNIFYGYAPPEGWRFIDSGTVPEPPA